jgi:hypothetical protein
VETPLTRAALSTCGRAKNQIPISNWDQRPSRVRGVCPGCAAQRRSQKSRASSSIWSAAGLRSTPFSM